MTTNPGINYAFLTPTINRDVEAGIRYGVIPLNDVCQAWCDSSETEYPDRVTLNCPKCKKEHELETGIDVDDPAMTCSCGEELYDGLEAAREDQEPICEFIDDGEYKATSDSQGDIFIIKSPYFTYAQFCSPCAPGACHLRSPLELPKDLFGEVDHAAFADNKCYCFDASWFEDEKAPYPVYSVATGELVEP